MRIVYDARLADSFSGLGRFAGELLLALLDADTRHDVRIDVLIPASDQEASSGWMRRLQAFVDRGRCVLHPVSIPPITFEQQWAMPRLLRRLGGDLYFYPHFDVPSGAPMPFVFVVHDLLPLKVPGYVQRFEKLKQRYFRACVRRGLSRGRRCMAVSETTKRDIVSEFGARWEPKVDVSYEGSLLDSNAVDRSLSAKLGVTGDYLLYVGTRRPNKNIRYMLDVFAEMRRGGYAGELVMAGSPKNFGFDANCRIAEIGGVRVLGVVSDAQLAALYAGMQSLMFLSTYEGFGLPVIEAARFGRPMILSNGGAISEIAPPSACVIPLETDAAAAAAEAVGYLRTMVHQHTPPTLDERFSWQAVAKTVFREAF